MNRVEYFVDGKLFAAKAMENPKISDYEYVGGLRSHIYICSTCGREWGRILCFPNGGWEAHSAPCESHKSVGVWDWSRTPGRLTGALCDDPPIWDYARKLSLLPREILLREFLLELGCFEKMEDFVQSA